MAIAIAEGGKKKRNAPEEQRLRIPQLPPMRSIPKEMRTPSSEGPIKKRILIVDDEEDWSALLAAPFRDDYEVYTAKNGAEGLRLFEEVRPDAMITDLKMPVMNGDELIRRARLLAFGAKFVLATVNRGDDIDEIVAELDPDMFVRKPADLAKLKADVESLLKKGEPDESRAGDGRGPEEE